MKIKYTVKIEKPIKYGLFSDKWVDDPELLVQLLALEDLIRYLQRDELGA